MVSSPSASATFDLQNRRIREEHLTFAIALDRTGKMEILKPFDSLGTIVDATIISAPSSTKNKEGKRDPEMHQTQKGHQWYHGMKIHAGVDAGSGYVHTIYSQKSRLKLMKMVVNN